MDLHGRVVRIIDVSGSQRLQMFALMETYYENMDHATFEADLSEKQWVIQVEDPNTGAIQGFSSQTLLDLTVEGRPIRALFSGDTIISREYWAQNPLAQIWGRFALSLIDASPAVELYWFLIAKGYKTYRYLPLFFSEFYPRYDVATPHWACQMIDALGKFKYPETYDASAGTIRAGLAGCRLRPGVADITDQRLRDPRVRFFVQRNPGHAQGGGLCCIAPLTRENFTRAAYRVIGPTATRSTLPA